MEFIKQRTAWNNLFAAILEENDYYTNLRDFAAQKGHSLKTMGEMLYEAYKLSPGGLCPYNFMDCLEENYSFMNEDFKQTIKDMVYFLYDKDYWK